MPNTSPSQCVILSRVGGVGVWLPFRKNKTPLQPTSGRHSILPSSHPPIILPSIHLPPSQVCDLLPRRALAPGQSQGLHGLRLEPPGPSEAARVGSDVGPGARHRQEHPVRRIRRGSPWQGSGPAHRNAGVWARFPNPMCWFGSGFLGWK